MWNAIVINTTADRPLSALARAGVLSTSLILAACSGDGTVVTLDEGQDFSVELPQALLTEFIDQASLRPRVTVARSSRPNETIAEVSINRRSEQLWSGTVNVEADRTYDLTVTWLERFMGVDLPLATLTLQTRVNADGTADELDRTDLDIGLNTIVDLDFDDDGRSNFSERQAGSNPLVDESDTDTDTDTDTETEAGTAAFTGQYRDTHNAVNAVNVALAPDNDGRMPAPPMVMRNNNTDTSDNVGKSAFAQIADVIVPRISKNNVPEIDGYGVFVDSNGQLAGEWAHAVQTDMSGALLTIENLMIDLNAEATASVPYRRWAALHDGRYLYLLVTIDDDGQRHRDSGNDVTDDDSLEIFLDADNSKSNTFDANHFHKLLPVKNAKHGASTLAGRSGIINGPNSSQAPLTIDFATGSGTGPAGLRTAQHAQDIYELRIDMLSAGISSDVPFGFELHVNDDDDGGVRDAKYGWHHPARQSADVDSTRSNPALMGTLLLE